MDDNFKEFPIIARGSVFSANPSSEEYGPHTVERIEWLQDGYEKPKNELVVRIVFDEPGDEGWATIESIIVPNLKDGVVLVEDWGDLVRSFDRKRIRVVRKPGNDGALRNIRITPAYHETHITPASAVKLDPSRVRKVVEQMMEQYQEDPTQPLR